MLTIKYNVKNGHHTTIPDGPHYLSIKNFTKLTPTQQKLFRQYIVTKKLDISLTESWLSSPENTRFIVQELEGFVCESKRLLPKFTETFLGWLLIILMFACPIYLAYHFSDWIQTQYVSNWIESLSNVSIFRTTILNTILFGDYGVISLGTYSFVWALPVVIMIGLSHALIDQSNLKSYIVWSIEPTIVRIGLNGSDIIPLLEGFGCNAAAITQAGHQCNSCTKIQCMSIISFGSSCSYQIGATLSIFNSANQSWLFFPYLIMVFVGGIMHGRIWGNKDNLLNNFSYSTSTINRVKVPNLVRLLQNVWGNIKMFVIQALPIFVGICIIVSVLSLTPILQLTSKIFEPILMLLDIPTELSPGVLFSMIRKDGMLLFNMNNGQLVQDLSSWKLLLLIFFSSTFTACSVTITMVMRQLGWLEGIKITMRQMITSLCCITLLGIITLVINLIS
ncbi:ferrous iron transporter B [Staphylococcus capitis]|uniref:nucleoside recognition domain-containing protein n=1 Tax=Staphylococcus capitis TaxID=29388 RepID=UPI000D1BEAC5|nr:nucleoside recognition domain-containing protein [Staphylococcus capitis]PTG35785.1 ferrous iron transporter B [Staphylococcus capitis]PTH08772.1 ferrous iron transporter B [Staphylococcus capitis]RIM44978.1 ferrous iron transporter B [Staphylococcus capitis]